MKPEKVLLIVNTGTPDSPEVSSVRSFLSEFLNDPDVIDINWLARRILVNFIIVPFRVRKSAKLYSRLWTEEGSPLRINLDSLVNKLNENLQGQYKVIGAMRYGNPSIRSALKKLPADSELTVLPLYPQYATATTLSVKKAVMREAASKSLSEIKFIDQFCYHPAFVNVFSSRIRSYDIGNIDHIVFSYHSLPVRQVAKVHEGIEPDNCDCTEQLPAYGRHCYKAACYHTSRLIARELDLPGRFFTTAFQSQMSEKWLGPFTEDIVRKLASEGKKRILVVAPSFVSDCLETIIEIREEYSDLFKSEGGEELVLIDGLNDSDDWVNSITEIIKSPDA